MKVVAWKGLSNIQEFYMLQPVCRYIIPCCALQSSVSGDARLKVVDWKSSLSTPYPHICVLYMLRWLFPVYSSSWH